MDDCSHPVAPAPYLIESTAGASVPPPAFVIVTACGAGAGPLATPVKGALSRDVAKMGFGVTVTPPVAGLPPALALTGAVPGGAPLARPLGESGIAPALPPPAAPV